MRNDSDEFFRSTLRHFATLRSAGIGESASAIPFPKDWFDLPERLWADLGAMTYLASLTAWHRPQTLAAIAALLEPPLRTGQYRVLRSGGQPRAFLTWAGLSPAAERRFAVDHQPLAPEDWASGTSKWLVSFVAPFGHIDQIVPLLTANPNETRVRTLWHNRTGDRYRVVEWSRPRPDDPVAVRSYGQGQFARLLEGG
jgi:hemolysin-activating ACP:hemolysin acyltransferase